MAIPVCGTFDYAVTVKRDTDAQDRWLGRAYSLRDWLIHPGMVGRRPLFALENGRILLTATESRLSILTNPNYRRWGRPVESASFEVGDAPAKVLQDGDKLFFLRLGTGDYALTIIHNEALVLGLGSVTGLPLGTEVQVEEDPRIKEMDLYYLAEDFKRIDDFESHVIWIDVAKGKLGAQLEKMNRTPRSKLLIVAIKGVPNKRGELAVPNSLYDRLLKYDSADSTYFYQVDERFADKQAWLAYVKALPGGRPKDLRLSFRIGHERIELCEGEEVFIGEYYIRVERVYRMGVPGELSSLAIARMTSGLNKDIVIQSARLLENAK